MTDEHCPCCGQTMPEEADKLAQQREAIIEWARANDVPLVLGDRLRLEDGAAYLGLATKTLRNWAAPTRAHPLPTKKVRGRVYLDLTAFAEFIVESAKD